MFSTVSTEAKHRRHVAYNCPLAVLDQLDISSDTGHMGLLHARRLVRSDGAVAIQIDVLTVARYTQIVKLAGELRLESASAPLPAAFVHAGKVGQRWLVPCLVTGTYCIVTVIASYLMSSSVSPTDGIGICGTRGAGQCAHARVPVFVKKKTDSESVTVGRIDLIGSNSANRVVTVARGASHRGITLLGYDVTWCNSRSTITVYHWRRTTNHKL
ncbi:hypothetical protein EDB86DRAFT_330029 [Lactarius hatsudake]|nr:hypothetical protein EDB86DRAFT_330029 [Lactarius hatsudake]